MNRPDEDVFREWLDELEEWSRSLGLYPQETQAMRMRLGPQYLLPGGDEDGPTRPLVIGMFLLGDEAFSERVQNPEAYSDEAMIQGIEHATTMTVIEERMKRFMEGEDFVE